jgi:acetyl-CoA carboxylase / biotin carboxylase 1
MVMVPGRARLGGIPVGVVAVETETVLRVLPADPGQPDSAEVTQPQAGQVSDGRLSQRWRGMADTHA